MKDNDANEFGKIGKEMTNGIWAGLEGRKGWLIERVCEMMRAIVSAVQEEMKIQSPSLVFAGIGKFMAMGLGDGFDTEMREVERTIRKATNAVVPAISKTNGDASASGRNKANDQTGTQPQIVQYITFDRATVLDSETIKMLTNAVDKSTGQALKSANKLRTAVVTT